MWCHLSNRRVMMHFLFLKLTHHLLLQMKIDGIQWRNPENLFGALPSFPSPPLFFSLLPSPPLRSKPHIAAEESGGALKLPSESPVAKWFLVYFKHYFNRERIENQILNSKIGVIIYIQNEKVVLNRANLRREMAKSQAKKIICALTIGSSYS